MDGLDVLLLWLGVFYIVLLKTNHKKNKLKNKINLLECKIYYNFYILLIIFNIIFFIILAKPQNVKLMI